MDRAIPLTIKHFNVQTTTKTKYLKEAQHSCEQCAREKS